MSNEDRCRTSFSYTLLFYFLPDNTFYDIHMQLFKIHKSFFKDKLDSTLSDEQNYEKIFLKSDTPDSIPWKIYFVTN